MNNNQDLELDPILNDDKWGYVDEAGNIAEDAPGVPLMYTQADGYTMEEIAAFKRKLKKDEVILHK